MRLQPRLRQQASYPAMAAMQASSRRGPDPLPLRPAVGGDGPAQPLVLFDMSLPESSCGGGKHNHGEPTSTAATGASWRTTPSPDAREGGVQRTQ